MNLILWRSINTIFIAMYETEYMQKEIS